MFHLHSSHLGTFSSQIFTRRPIFYNHPWSTNNRRLSFFASIEDEAWLASQKHQFLSSLSVCISRQPIAIFGQKVMCMVLQETESEWDGDMGDMGPKSCTLQVSTSKRKWVRVILLWIVWTQGSFHLLCICTARLLPVLTLSTTRLQCSYTRM